MTRPGALVHHDVDAVTQFGLALHLLLNTNITNQITHAPSAYISENSAEAEKIDAQEERGR